MQHIGIRIKALREERNMSQTQLAIKTGYTDRTSISKIESGKIDISQAKLSVFARALGTNVETLIGLDNKAQTSTPTTPPASLTDNQRVLLDLFRQVPEDKQALVVQMIKTAVSELNKI